MLYYVLEGNVSKCSGAGATFRCIEVTYAASWDLRDWTLVGAVSLLALAPFLSAWLRSALPSVLAAIGLAVLFAIYPIFLWSWVPAEAFIVAAAIAGPRLTRRSQETEKPSDPLKVQ